jgi:hypothetical protein
MVIRSHDPSIDVTCHSLEKISILSLSLKQKSCHESSCGRGKRELKRRKNSLSEMAKVAPDACHR